MEQQTLLFINPFLDRRATLANSQAEGFQAPGSYRQTQSTTTPVDYPSRSAGITEFNRENLEFSTRPNYNPNLPNSSQTSNPNNQPPPTQQAVLTTAKQQQSTSFQVNATIKHIQPPAKSLSNPSSTASTGKTRIHPNQVDFEGIESIELMTETTPSPSPRGRGIEAALVQFNNTLNPGGVPGRNPSITSSSWADQDPGREIIGDLANYFESEEIVESQLTDDLTSDSHLGAILAPSSAESSASQTGFTLNSTGKKIIKRSDRTHSLDKKSKHNSTLQWFLSRYKFSLRFTSISYSLNFSFLRLLYQ